MSSAHDFHCDREGYKKRKAEPKAEKPLDLEPESEEEQKPEEGE